MDWVSPSFNLWDPTITSLALQNTSPFYQHLIGPTPPKEDDCQEISQEIQYNSLIACSDGSYDCTTSHSSHSWVFGSGIKTLLATGAGPVDGANDYISSYRVERLLAVLYITYCISDYYQLNSRKLTSYCDNKGAANNSFKPIQVLPPSSQQIMTY
jgi:hypothetical protein